jgi:hypothetical protein
LGAAASTKRPTSCVLTQEFPSTASEKIKKKWTKILKIIQQQSQS